MEQPKQTDGASLIERVYALALERIDELMGCTEESPEERELSLWAEIADRIEQNGWTTAMSRVRPETTGRGGSVRLNSSLRRDKWSPAGFRLPRIAAAG